LTKRGLGVEVMTKLDGGDDLRNLGNMERLCITVPEAAKMLGISRNFCYELVKQKQLPVVKFGKRLLIPRAALIKMLEQQGVATIQKAKSEAGNEWFY
jgi:excisionase family DNA binding protein